MYLSAACLPNAHNFDYQANNMCVQLRLFVLIHLLLLVFNVVEPFRTQSAGVRGILMCGDKPLKNTKVKLVDLDRGPDLDDVMGTTKTDSEGKFQVSGKTSELTTIDVQLRIYHDCDDSLPCQRAVTFNVPDKFVNSGATVTKFFEIGRVNMQIIFPKEARSCIN